MTSVKYSIIVPAYNAEERIEKTLNDLLGEFKNENFEVLVICNNCSDRTYEIAKKFKYPLLSLNFPDRIGKGGAILEGFKIASGEIVGFTDADGFYSPKTVKRMINELEKSDYDCIIASRKNRMTSPVHRLMTRNVASMAWNVIVRFLFGLPFYDTQAGLKFFRKSALDSIDKRFVCKTFSFDVELLYKLKQKKFKIKELDVERDIMRENPRSSVHMRDIFEMLASLLKFRFITLIKDQR